MKLKYLLSALLVVIFSNCSKPVKTVKVLQVPGKDQFCKIDINGVTVLPSGRYATPVGEVIRITNDPYGMQSHPMEKKLLLCIMVLLQ